MSEIVEGEVVYSCSNAKLVPSLTHRNIGNREGTLRISGTLLSCSMAASLNGTRLDLPFFVMGKKAVLWLRMICSHRKTKDFTTPHGCLYEYDDWPDIPRP